MRKQHTYKSVTLRFRRWSRKGYAAFVSIQYAVTIGQLSVHVSERFQEKNSSNHATVLISDKNGKENCEGEEDHYRDEHSESLLTLFLRSIVYPVPATLSPVASYIYIYNRITFPKSRKVQLRAEGLPRFSFIQIRKLYD